MAMNNLEGVIYKVLDYKESSKLLFVYTKEGKITLNARGSKRINSEYRIIAQYLNKISFESNGKEFQNLIKGKLINDFSEIKKDFNLTKRVNLIFEIISKTIIDNKYHNTIYNLINECLNSNNILISVLSFSLKMLYYLGYGMDLISDGKEVIGFNINLGRVVYKNENYKLDLNLEETVLLLKLTYNKINDLPNIEEEKIKVISDFIYYYYIDKLELNLKSLK